VKPLPLLLILASACGGGDPPAVDGGLDQPDGGAPTAAEVYPTGRTLSPITPHVAANLRAIAGAASQQDRVFAKVGASATVSSNFMHCFAGPDVDLDGRDLEATVDWFGAGEAGGTNPYQRDSEAATVGWSAGRVLTGDPSPLENEVAAARPRFAVIMYGTNDIQLRDISGYGANLLAIADFLIERGVIPVFTTIMPRDDSAEADAWVPRYNLMMRAVAQARQVPLIDYHRELLPLPDHGLGPDGIHPNVSPDGACALTVDGLQHGYNVRNLITLQALEALRAVVVDGAAAPDPASRSITGAGLVDDPFEIDALPFVHAADTGESPSDLIDVYDGCGASQDESGPEYFYRFELEQTTTIRAFLADRPGVDIDLHLLGGPTGADCIARDHQVLVEALEPGTYYLSLDTFVSGGAEQAGEYLLVVMEETP
jgi:hypothetical protein